jgi:hypothetical protein
MTDITACISTKDRYYSTLPHTLLAICNQTYKPKHILIFDDGEFKDLRNDSLYSHIFRLIYYYGITYEMLQGEKKGQVLNHIKSLTKAKTEWIWRLDDDNVPEADVLEKLVKNIADDVAAIGGLVIEPNKIKQLPITASNQIEDIFLGMNRQWYLHSGPAYEVDHLYSSFLYRKSIASYNTELSIIGHREETMLTYEMKRKGYKIILDPSAKTWHFCNPAGGIRSNESERTKNALHDEHIFMKKMIEWNIKENEYSFIVLDNGIGDHYVFKSCLKDYFDKNKNKQHVFFVCYPEVFADITDIKLASIADAIDQFGNLDRFSIYKWAWDNNLKENMVVARRKMLDLTAETEKKKAIGYGDTIIISPFSRAAKNYPYWNEFVNLMLQQNNNFKLIQIGKAGEPQIQGIHEYFWNLPFATIEKMIRECKLWISVDNFLPHLVNCMEAVIPGVVIWGISDPKLFGYDYNTNILKSKIFLRLDQFNSWNGIELNKDAFVSPESLAEQVTRLVV